ncbi:MAG: histidine kinase [Anaerolineales bacterium]|nr:histidine kinase [Anaerolineales bacterium]
MSERDQPSPEEALPRPSSQSALRRRLGMLKWLAPGMLVLLVVGYELLISRTVHDMLGPVPHYALDILVYGTVGPVLIFWLLHFLSRWLDERETSELQATILAQARERVRAHQELNDSTLQSLFATSLFLNAVEANLRDLPPEARTQLHAANQSLDRVIRQLREHLLQHRG